MTRRAVNESFNILAWPCSSPALDPDDIAISLSEQRGLRTHYYDDCSQLVSSDCRPVRLSKRWLDGKPERALCWTCVGRLVEAAERAIES